VATIFERGVEKGEIMPDATEEDRPTGRRWRPAILAVLFVVVVSAIWFASSRVPRPLAREAAAWTLLSIRVVHELAWLFAPAGIVVLGWRVVRGRRLGIRRPKSARWLLACGSILLGLATLELTASVYRAKAHRILTDPVVVPDPQAEPAMPGDLYLVVLGESSARGVPYWMWLSVGRIVERELRLVFPGRRVLVEVLAEDGATLEQALGKLSSLKYMPAAVIVYAGHNEVSGRFPLGRAVPHYADEVTLIDHLSAWVRRVSPLDQMLQEGLDTQGRDGPPRVEQRRLVDVPVCTPEESARLRHDFQARLEALVLGCGRAGVLPILVIPPGNDGGFEPNRSVLAASTGRADRQSLEREFAAIRAAEGVDASRCREAYRSILTKYPEFAEAHFRLARLLERSGAFDEANRHYILARDLDGLPIRCLTADEDAYRAAATRGDCVLVDGPAVLRRDTKHGILDGRVLHDAQHPTLIGYVALARDLLGQLQSRGAFGWPRGTPAPTLDPAACASQFGMDRREWEFVCHYSEVMYGTSSLLRYEGSERRAAELRYKIAAKRLLDGDSPEALGLFDDGVISGISPAIR
jgi:hypothetical protein